MEQKKKEKGVIVLDYGSQYTLLIVRRLREIGIYAEIADGRVSEPPSTFQIKGIILSGGPDSVGEEGARSLPIWVLKKAEENVPILGICYGMQLLVEAFKGKVRSAACREYGHAEMIIKDCIDTIAAKKLFFFQISKTSNRQVVWMSHGDDIVTLPSSFEEIGRTKEGVIASIAHRTLPIIALQFHPEVHHTDCGKEILKGFVTELCGLELTWTAGSMMERIGFEVKEVVGAGTVLVAVSGGVDSTITASLLVKILGPHRVTSVIIDHGLMRKNEVAWVAENLKRIGLDDLHVINAEDRFLTALAGISDPEQKRKIIGRAFIEEFETFAKSIGCKRGFTHLAQGTLYPDVIESAGHGVGAKVIKSHHNVGGLPEKMGLKLVEPFRFLFKDEVRKLGEELGLPLELIYRHPFPGPGLGVRILGDITKEKLDLLREADDIFIRALRREHLYDSIWQAFAVLLPVKSVGVMGDNRTYQWTIALRAVVATDGMTASVGALPMDFLTRTAGEIVRNVNGINRVVYDITSKPPATIEWE